MFPSAMPRSSRRRRRTTSVAPVILLSLSSMPACALTTINLFPGRLPASSSTSSSTSIVGARRSLASTSTMCDMNGGSSMYSEKLIGFKEKMRKITASGCPNHFNGQLNPSRATKAAIPFIPKSTPQDYEVHVPVYPMLQAGGAALDLSLYGGILGLARNGVAITSAFSGHERTFKRINALTTDAVTLDRCGGHPGENGAYHYNAPPSCLVAQLHHGLPATAHSRQVGWALDGFPIYGPAGPGGAAMKVCGETGADASACLDACNGFAGELPGVDGYTYRYYMTGPLSDGTSDPLSPVPDESFFPFTPLCLRGCCPDSVIDCAGLLPRCGAGAAPGTAQAPGAFVPFALDGLVTPPGTPTPAPTPAPTAKAADMSKFGLNQACYSLLGLMAGSEAAWTCEDLPVACCASYTACNGVIDTLYGLVQINDALAQSLSVYLVPRCHTHVHTLAVTVADSDPPSGSLRLADRRKTLVVDGRAHRTIVANRGHAYRFDQSDASNRRQGISFSLTPDGTHTVVGARGERGRELDNAYEAGTPAPTRAPTPAWRAVAPWRATAAPTPAATLPAPGGVYHGNLRGSVGKDLRRTGRVAARVAFVGTPGRPGAYAQFAFAPDMPASVYYYSESTGGAGGRIVDYTAVGDTEGGCTCLRGWRDYLGDLYAVCAVSANSGGVGWCYVDQQASPGCGVQSSLDPAKRWGNCKAGWETHVLAADGLSVRPEDAAAAAAAAGGSGGAGAGAGAGRAELLARVTSFVADMLAKLGVPHVELRGKQVEYQEQGHRVRAVRVFDSAAHAGTAGTAGTAGVAIGTAATTMAGGGGGGRADGSVVPTVHDHPYPASASLGVAAHGGRVEGRYDERTKILHLHLLGTNRVYAARVEMR